MKIPLALVIALLLLAGCASHPKHIDCEGRLKAINAPAPAASLGTHP